jgi:oligogalacturonide lyase
VRALLAHGLLLVLSTFSSAAPAEQPPRDWIDPSTGHRIVRLSEEPGSASLYFHQYPFSRDGRLMAFSTPHGIAAVDLQTHKVRQLVPSPARLIAVGHKSGDAYYLRDNQVFAANMETGESRLAAKLPDQYLFRRPSPPRENSSSARGPTPGSPGLRPPPQRGGALTPVAVNADETLLVCIGADPEGKPEPRSASAGDRSDRLAARWAAGLPLLIYTIDVATGESKVIHRSHDWLNHLQCSPTDPEQILFCHEGPWHLVDRSWLIRTDGSRLKLVHPRTMHMEIAGHEFFDSAGDAVWYDLQTPRSLVFWLARYDVKTGERRWYHLNRDEWSVHYNISPDGQLLCGDGGGPSSVANQLPNSRRLDPPGNGQWLYLFKPELSRRRDHSTKDDPLITVGTLHAERLVDLSKHDYDLEPNGIFTPDNRWIIFRSNMHGPSHVYAVEIQKTR